MGKRRERSVALDMVVLFHSIQTSSLVSVERSIISHGQSARWRRHLDGSPAQALFSEHCSYTSGKRVGKTVDITSSNKASVAISHTPFSSPQSSGRYFGLSPLPRHCDNQSEQANWEINYSSNHVAASNLEASSILLVWCHQRSGACYQRFSPISADVPRGELLCGSNFAPRRIIEKTSGTRVTTEQR